MSLYHPEIVRGGAQQVCFDLFEALENTEGVEATLLAAVDPTLEMFYKTGAVITGFDGRERQFIYLSRDYDYMWHKTSSHRAVEALAEFLTITAPDIVHIHHFLLFGIDVLTLVRRTLPDVRIVFTFHEFLALCHADGHLLRRTDRSVCSGPSMVRCSQCFPELRHSYFFLREHWFRRHLEAVDILTVPSPFMVGRYRQFGVAAEKLVCVPNGVPPTDSPRKPTVRADECPKFGFFGQLVDVKGVGLILEAAQILASEGFQGFRIEINGDNLRFGSEELRDLVAAAMDGATRNASGDALVTFNGSYSRHELSFRMGRVDWCIIPSLWPESYCLVLSEAWAHGLVPIAADLGALGDRVVDDVNGLLFSAGDARSLARAIRRAASTVGLGDRLRHGRPLQTTTREMADLYLDLYRGSGRTAATSFAGQE